MIQLTVYGVALPQGSKSARVVKGRAILTEGFGDGPRRRKAWRDAVADAAREWQKTHNAALLEGPLRFEAWFYLPRPKSAPKRVAMPAKKPDASKLLRSVEDALTGIIWHDDAQIVTAHVFKRFALFCPPHAVLRIGRVEEVGEDCATTPAQREAEETEDA